MDNTINKLSELNHFYMAAVQVTFKKGVVKTELVNVMFEASEMKVNQELLSMVNSQACRLIAERNKLKPEFITASAIVTINYLGHMTANEMFQVNEERVAEDATTDEQPQSEPASGDLAGGEPV